MLTGTPPIPLFSRHEDIELPVSDLSQAAAMSRALAILADRIADGLAPPPAAAFAPRRPG